MVNFVMGILLCFLVKKSHYICLQKAPWRILLLRDDKMSENTLLALASMQSTNEYSHAVLMQLKNLKKHSKLKKLSS